MGIENQDGENRTQVKEFILLGFPGPPSLQILIFTSFLLMYILSIFGNISIIILVTTSRCLHTPMYFFLCSLSFLEIWYTTTTVPKALYVVLGINQNISFSGCLAQMYFVFSFGATEYFLLSLMAFDRYMAICHPLHYHTIMDISLCGKLAVFAWVTGFFFVSPMPILISRLSFCGPNVINHFCCNIDSWIVLSCTDAKIVKIAIFIISILIILGSCVITLLSYIFIIATILRIPSATGQKKAFSTCFSHLLLVIIWYGSTIVLFVKPSEWTSLETTKIVNILNTIVVPVLNPFIYTLRNKDVKEALRQSLHRR